nr:gamma carbonic anhydrase 1, mitochondrial-like [Tanacetum cinerariifolium]GEW31987.1 gamma carbonic anhydrase 1, mitochondrial-like [Tanacetum cinerariifolium]
EGLEAEDHEAGLALLKSLLNEVILGEEVASKLTVYDITKQIYDTVQDRTEKGDVNNISIGSGTNIQDHSLVHVAKSNLPGKVHPTVIGDNVIVDEAFVSMKAILLDGGSCREACHGCCYFFTVTSTLPLNNSELYLDQ